MKSSEAELNFPNIIQILGKWHIHDKWGTMIILNARLTTHMHNHIYD